MAVNIPDRIDFLKRIHLFRGLDEDQLTAVAEQLQEQRCDTEELILRQGEEGDHFFLIYSGRVSVTHRRQGREQELAKLVPRDYFGEEALLRRSHRTATVVATEPTILLTLERYDFNNLLKKAPDLRANFNVAVESRRLVRQVRFKWIRPGEVIYFLARKHPIVLYESLTGPFFALVIPLGIFAFYLLTATLTPLLLSGVALLVILGWTGWKYLDWTNDFYIVTNQRVIWLEKVIGMYDSRQEAPLTTILSVGVETSQLGRVMDYGDVIVRTFVGRIPLSSVSRPYQAASLIEEHWTRSREGSRRADLEAMRLAIREKLGLPTVKPPGPEPQTGTAPSIYKPSALRVILSNLFKMRIEESSGTITYRKHYFVLLKQTLFPSLLGLGLIAAVIYHWTQVGLAADTPAVAMLFLFFLDFLWWLYQYVDWRNDKFQVTQDQIFDIDRRPFGLEQRKAAPLDNILSTEYKRQGLLQVLLNYGNVYITVGGAQLVFEDVQDPPSVQQDIDRRRMARLERKRQDEVAAERDRLSSWIATYHRDAEEYRREQDVPKSNENEVK